MTWLTNLNPALAAAVVSAVVSLVVALITALLAPTVKYGLDMRLERRKLELVYIAEQSKSLRDRIGFHKGTILNAAEELGNRMRNYQETLHAPRWLRSRGYYARTFAFRILAYWYAISRFSREAVYIDAAVATKGDWAFVKAVKLNLDIWSEVGLFEGLGYSGDFAADHFFSGQIDSLVDAFTNSEHNHAITGSEFNQLIDNGTNKFDLVFNYLSELQRTAWQLKYQRLVASHLVIIATVNSFGYDHQKTSVEQVREIASHCGPEVRSNLRQLILDLQLASEGGFRELVRVLEGSEGRFRELVRVLEGSRSSTSAERNAGMQEILIRSSNRRLAGRLFEPQPSRETAPGETSHAGLLFVHGLNSNQSGYAARARAATLKLGLSCLTFDLGGHGKSTGIRGELSRSDHLQDLKAAYDWLQSSTGVDPARIGVCGASYGGYLACLLLSERPVKWLLLRAPALYGDEKSGSPLEEHQEKLSVPEPNTALHNLNNFDGRTLVLESERDDVISHAVIERYLAAGKHPTHHVIEGARHRLVREEEKARFLDEILNWFRGL
jgi:pimeloyl-ACP methyl ester carboxylesterase